MVACAPRRRRHRRALKRGEGARRGPGADREACEGRADASRRKTFQPRATQLSVNLSTRRSPARYRGAPEPRPFPLLSPRAAESGATTRLRIYAAIFTVFSARKKATRGAEEISTARVYSHAAGTAHGTRRPDQTPRNRPLHQPSTRPVRRPASGLERLQPAS